MSEPSDSQKKKVLFFITKSNWGGAQRYVFDLATTLDQTQYEPVVLLGGNGQLVEKLTEAGVRTITLSTLQRDISITKELHLMRELWRILKQEQPDVLHVNSSKAGGIGCFIGRLARVPRVIFTAHGWAFNEDRPWWQKLIIKKLHWWTVIMSHRTIAVSQAIVDQMNWPFARRNMLVINPGRTIPTFASRLNARTDITQIHPPLAPYLADVWLMIIAELHPIKQHQKLFTAMKEISVAYPHTRLICVGDGELRSTLDHYVQEHELASTIFLTGSILEAATLLKAADLFVLPSQSESYGYVLHEAGLARVPIIASDVGGIRNIVTNGETGTLIDPSSDTALTNSITKFLRSPHVHNNQAERLYTQLSKRTVAAMCEATTKVYES